MTRGPRPRNPITRWSNSGQRRTTDRAGGRSPLRADMPAARSRLRRCHVRRPDRPAPYGSDSRRPLLAGCAVPQRLSAGYRSRRI